MTCASSSKSFVKFSIRNEHWVLLIDEQMGALTPSGIVFKQHKNETKSEVEEPHLSQKSFNFPPPAPGFSTRVQMWCFSFVRDSPVRAAHDRLCLQILRVQCRKNSHQNP